MTPPRRDRSAVTDPSLPAYCRGEAPRLTLWPYYGMYLPRMLSNCRTTRDYTRVEYACAICNELRGIQRRHTGDRPAFMDPSRQQRGKAPCLTLWPHYGMYLPRMLSNCRTTRDYTGVEYACATCNELRGIQRHHTGDRPAVMDHF